jgi:hypothetical protein
VLLSTTTELLIINPVPQRDPQAKLCFPGRSLWWPPVSLELRLSEVFHQHEVGVVLVNLAVEKRLAVWGYR